MKLAPHTLALAGAVLLSVAACGKKAPEGPPNMPPPEVGTVVLQPQTVPIQEDLVGRLAPVRSADVRARIPGVLQRRVYDEGTDVKAGQVLFIIDPLQLQADVGAAQAALAAAQATAANAKAAADRARQLAPKQFISRSDLDTALANERSSAAAVQQARSAGQTAQLNLGYATVRAPIDGRAGKQQVTEGALVGQGDVTLLTTVDQIDPLFVNFSMSAGEASRVRALRASDPQGKTSRVQVVLADGSLYGESGVLDFSGDTVDPTTGAISLRARLPNPDHSLLPGAYVTIKATLGAQPGVYLVPQAAVQRDATSAFLLVLGADGKVARKDITTDRTQAGNWVVSAGPSPGDQVIVSGIQRAEIGKPAKGTPWQPAVANGKPGAAAPAAAAPGAAAAAGGATPAKPATNPDAADAAPADGAPAKKG